MSVSELNQSRSSDSTRPCSLPRRIGAMIYDGLALVAIWMLGTVVIVIVGNRGIDSGNLLYQCYLLLLAFAYFHLSWQRIGQTLGMRTWRIRLDPGDRPFTLARSLLRFAGGMASIASLGVGFAWALLRRDRCAWPDLASRSRLVRDGATANGA
ncbi:MAG: RDD family protein [Wenzhouxiangellaceae bacterium]|nr:RDD family protein [Wenzhouxiangellaceae bacterium]